VASLGFFGLIFSSLFFKWGGLFVFVPGEIFGVFDGSAGLKQYIIAHLMLIAKAITITTCGLMFSSFNVKPAAGNDSRGIVHVREFYFDANSVFRRSQPWFLTYHLNVWQNMFAQPIPCGAWANREHSGWGSIGHFLASAAQHSRCGISNLERNPLKTWSKSVWATISCANRLNRPQLLCFQAGKNPK